MTTLKTGDRVKYTPSHARTVAAAADADMTLAEAGGRRGRIVGDLPGTGMVLVQWEGKRDPARCGRVFLAKAV